MGGTEEAGMVAAGSEAGSEAVEREAMAKAGENS